MAGLTFRNTNAGNRASDITPVTKPLRDNHR